MALQGGMIAYRQLSELGLSAFSIRGLVSDRRLVQRTEHPRRSSGSRRGGRQAGGTVKSHITTSVFAAHAGPLPLESMQWRAVLSGPERSRLGGLSSCVRLDLDRQAGTLMHVVYPGCDWDPPRGVQGHRTTHIPEEDCAETDGLPHFSAARSLMDATLHTSADRLDDMLDRAIVLRLFDSADMQRVIDERRNRPEATRLEQALARLDERSGQYESALERRTVALILSSAKIPMAPVVNVVADGYGHRPDIQLPGTRVIIECDGRAGHTTLAERIADERREAILKALGFVLLRVTWHQVVYEPERTLRRIEDFVLANGGPPVPVA